MISSPTRNIASSQYNGTMQQSSTRVKSTTSELSQPRTTANAAIMSPNQNVIKSRKQQQTETIRSPVKSPQVATTSRSVSPASDVRKSRKPEDFFQEFFK